MEITNPFPLPQAVGAGIDSRSAGALALRERKEIAVQRV